MLMVLDSHRALPPDRLARAANLDDDQLHAALAELSRRVLVVTHHDEDGAPWIAITTDGDEAMKRYKRAD